MSLFGATDHLKLTVSAFNLKKGLVLAVFTIVFQLFCHYNNLYGIKLRLQIRVLVYERKEIVEIFL